MRIAGDEDVRRHRLVAGRLHAEVDVSGPDGLLRVAWRSRPTGPSVGIGYGVGRTVRNAKRPSAPENRWPRAARRVEVGVLDVVHPGVVRLPDVDPRARDRLAGRRQRPVPHEAGLAGRSVREVVPVLVARRALDEERPEDRDSGRAAPGAVCSGRRPASTRPRTSERRMNSCRRSSLRSARPPSGARSRPSTPPASGTPRRRTRAGGGRARRARPPAARGPRPEARADRLGEALVGEVPGLRPGEPEVCVHAALLTDRASMSSNTEQHRVSNGLLRGCFPGMRSLMMNVHTTTGGDGA